MSIDTPRSPSATSAGSAGGLVALFALLGPLVGSLALMSAMAAFGKTSGGSNGALFGIVLVAGYMFGVVPAALTGFAVSYCRRDVRSIIIPGLVIGAVVAGLFGALVSSVLGEPPGGVMSFVWMFGSMGAVAGLCCGAIYDRWPDPARSA